KRPSHHPVMHAPGWWRRPDRFHGLPRWPAGMVAPATNGHSTCAPILITGAQGTLGRALSKLCAGRGLPHHATSRHELDITNVDSVRAAFSKFRPWALVNAAGYVRVDEAERDAERCYRENTLGAACLAGACAEADVRFVTFSSDLVFDGERSVPYTESDAVHPLGVYGLTKAKAEHETLSRLPSTLVVRTSAFFGPWDAHNFVSRALARLRAGVTLRAAEDVLVSPTYLPDLVHACLDLLIDGESGVWHLANEGAVSWAEFARRAASVARVATTCLEPYEGTAAGQLALRPRYSVLGSERGRLLGDLDNAIRRYVQECAVT
ncbi:MAG TPA: SDR family oxidoreductase, partial [Planctomycetota bacterium]|nr:SDR family oxidoreductase [Planctomycetota bacterium]